MEIVNLCIRRLKEAENFENKDVKLTDVVPELYLSLPSDFTIDTHENFTDIPYPTINRDCCDMLIGAYNMYLITTVEEPRSIPVYGFFQAIHSQVGSVILAVYLIMSKTSNY